MRPRLEIALALLVFCHAGMTHASAQSSDRLNVLAQVRPEPYYVGQAIDLSVGVVAGRERPKLTMPGVANADLTLVGTDMKAISAGGIGDAVFEKNLFRSRYRLIPRRPGTLTIPPVTARLGDRSGASVSLTIPVRNLPAAGRPAEFLGGVGKFEVEASAEPTSVRAGESINYRITVRGPGARGVKQPPNVARLDRLPLGLRVDRLPDQAVDDPPSLTFAFRLRPTRAGDATLPPVSIAGFDPKTSLYVTKATPGVPIRVVDVPRFDPAKVRYEPPVLIDDLRRYDLTAFAIGSLLLVSTAIAVRLVRRRVGRPDRSVKRLPVQVARQLNRSKGHSEHGRVLTEGLVTYLNRVLGRPPGALTPTEAETGVLLATGSEDLAARAGRLVTGCDEVRFNPDSPSSDGLSERGLQFFRDLCGGTRRQGEEWRGGETR